MTKTAPATKCGGGRDHFAGAKSKGDQNSLTITLWTSGSVVVSVQDELFNAFTRTFGLLVVFFSSSYSIKIRVMFNYFVKMFKRKINITDLKMGINMLYAVGGTCRIAHGDYHYILFHKKVISLFFLLCTLAQSALWNLHNNMPRLLNLILLEFGFSARVGRICEPM